MKNKPKEIGKTILVYMYLNKDQQFTVHTLSKNLNIPITSTAPTISTLLKLGWIYKTHRTKVKRLTWHYELTPEAINELKRLIE